jgi:hypothetical protein
MPAWYKIDKEHKLVMSTGSGVLTLAEMLDHQNKLAADPEFDPGYSQLMDFSHVTKIDATAADIPLLAQRNVFSPTARRAILVASDQAEEYSELFRKLREPLGDRGIKTFRSLDEALDWLVRKV